MRLTPLALRAESSFPAAPPLTSPDRMRLPLFLGLAAFALTAFAPATGGATDGATVELANDSSSTIVFVYASTCDEDTWGEDLLPVDILEPGSGATITMDAGCWDLKAVTDSGQELEHFGVELGDDEEVTWTVTDAD